jgi:hypothetical protein
MMEQ